MSEIERKHALNGFAAVMLWVPVGALAWCLIGAALIGEW